VTDADWRAGSEDRGRMAAGCRQRAGRARRKPRTPLCLVRPHRSDGLPARVAVRRDVPASLIPRSGTQRIVIAMPPARCPARHARSTAIEKVFPVPRMETRHNALGTCGDYTRARESQWRGKMRTNREHVTMDGTHGRNVSGRSG
jgi:hypothetical protein